MKRISAIRRFASIVIATVAFMCLGSAWAAPQGAAYTTFDAATGGCLDGNNPNGINCNNYDLKTSVYMSGGPTSGGLSDGCYYFAVLTPGSQNSGFIDGATGNLSDTTVGGTTGDLGSGDSEGNRTFRVTNHTITYPDTTCDPASGGHNPGTDPQGNPVVQLMPYDDTDNPGGVYILAVCEIDATSPSQCKYDMFKVKESASPSTVAISACKFNDRNDNGAWDPNGSPDEPLIPNWPIIATINGTPVTQNTDDSGCTIFTVSPGDPVSIIEGTPLGSGWTQTAPNVIDSNASFTVDANHVVSVTNPIVDGTTVYFGNFNPLCSTDGSCEEPPSLDISKTASNTTTWNITKSVDKTQVELFGGNATFNYTVTLGYTLSTTVSGTITLSNNSPADISATDLSDSLANCTFTADSPATTLVLPRLIAAGDHLNVNYTCDLGAATTNSATVSWADFGGGSATTDPAVKINFVDTCATVQDVFGLDGFPPTVTTNLQPKVCNTDTPNPHTFTYSQTVPVPSGCATYDNTATFTTNDTGTKGSASKQVTVCQAPATMGYWKNHAANSKSGGPNYSADCSKLKSSSCSTNGPWTKQYLPQSLGGYSVSSILVADPIWGAANCSSTTSQGAVACLAAQLLAAKLNLANGACPGNPAISTTIAAADAFLTNPPSPPGVVNYTGPSGTYNLTAVQRATAISLKTTLDTYNNGNACF